MNLNALGIVLQHEASQQRIHFLDLNIEVRDGALVTTTQRQTNRFISQGSFRHPSWLKSIPRSQFLRLQRNCMVVHDQQASLLKSSFTDRGYKN